MGPCITSLLSRSMDLRCQLNKMFYMLLRDYYKAWKVLVTRGKNCLGTGKCCESQGYIRVGGGGTVGEGDDQKGHLIQDSQSQKAVNGDFGVLSLSELCIESVRFG